MILEEMTQVRRTFAWREMDVRHFTDPQCNTNHVRVTYKWDDEDMLVDVCYHRDFFYDEVDAIAIRDMKTGHILKEWTGRNKTATKMIELIRLFATREKERREYEEELLLED